jgi:hypothetical protein
MEKNNLDLRDIKSFINSIIVDYIDYNEIELKTNKTRENLKSVLITLINNPNFRGDLSDVNKHLDNYVDSNNHKDEIRGIITDLTPLFSEGDVIKVFGETLEQNQKNHLKRLNAILSLPIEKREKVIDIISLCKHEFDFSKDINNERSLFLTPQFISSLFKEKNSQLAEMLIQSARKEAEETEVNLDGVKVTRGTISNDRKVIASKKLDMNEWAGTREERLNKIVSPQDLVFCYYLSALKDAIPQDKNLQAFYRVSCIELKNKIDDKKTEPSAVEMLRAGLFLKENKELRLNFDEETKKKFSKFDKIPSFFIKLLICFCELFGISNKETTLSPKLDLKHIHKENMEFIKNHKTEQEVQPELGGQNSNGFVNQNYIP